MAFFEAFMFIFDMLLNAGVAAGNMLESIHWALPWIVGALLGIPAGVCSFKFCAG